MVGSPAQKLTLTWKEGEPAPRSMSCEYGAAVAHGDTAYFSQRYSVYSYTVPTNKWKDLPPCKHEFFSLAILHSRLTAIGGRQENSFGEYQVSNSLFYLSGSLLNTWRELFSPMTTSRSFPGVVTTKTHLVVAGGRSESYDSLNTVEIMDTETLQWSTACSLPQVAGHPHVTLCNGYVYVSIYGTVYTSAVEDLLRSCEQQASGESLSGSTRPTRIHESISSSYDKGNRTVWTLLADIPKACYYSASLTTLARHVVVVDTDIKSLNYNTLLLSSKDSENDHQNGDDGVWCPIGRLPTPRSGAMAAVFPSSQQLLVVGGVAGQQTSSQVTTSCTEIGHFDLSITTPKQ